MKANYNFFLALLFIFFSAVINGQITIAQWNFNGSSDVTIPGGATSPFPSTGMGTAMLIGGISATFKSGSTLDPIGNSSNFAWQTSSYAPLSTGDKQRGIQFNVNTVGFQDIMFKFDQRLSNTANNTYVVQYTIDRTTVSPDWIDFHMFTFTPEASGTGDMWYFSNARTVDFSSVTAINNNPKVAFRIVSAFDPTSGNYLSAATKAAGAPVSYGTSGTVRYDMVTFMGSQTTLDLNKNVYDDKAFFFYPNPVNGNFIFFNRIVSVRIFDMVGKMVIDAKDVDKLNLANLSSGIYFIENENKISHKIIRD
jgi:hypothetical protein